MSRPLLISDCDEVLLHMVVPFRDWLDEAHDVHFELEGDSFTYALRHKLDGTQIESAEVWKLLNGFFDTEMYRQQAIEGAVDSINRVSEIADVAILTNLLDHRAEARAEQLKAVGINAPVYTNQGGKGEALKRVLEQFQPSMAVFVDDLGHQHESVAGVAPEIWRLHLVGEPKLARHITPSPYAHARIDNWAEALPWILDKLQGATPAPPIEMETI